MTIREYELRMLAFNLSQVDEEMKRHQQAFLNDAVRAKNKKGEPIYKQFSDFYDHEERINNVLEGSIFEKEILNEERKRELTQVAKRLREFREGRGTI